MDSERLYDMCVKGMRKGWEEASHYVYGVVSWRGWSLNQEEKEDVVQNTLLYFLSGGLEKVEKPKAFKHLLKLKALGNILDRTRRHPPTINTHSTMNKGNDPMFPPIPAGPDNPHGNIFWNQAITICREVIASMEDKRCREILPIYFRYKAIGESIGRIARDLEKPLGTIASWIHRCLKLLYSHPRIIQLKEELLG